MFAVASPHTRGTDTRRSPTRDNFHNGGLQGSCVHGNDTGIPPTTQPLPCNGWRGNGLADCPAPIQARLRVAIVRMRGGFA